MKTLLAFLLLASSAFADSLCVRVVETQADAWGRPIRVEGHGTAVTLNRTKTGHWVAITARHVVRDVEPSSVFVGIDNAWQPVAAIYRLESGDDAAFLTFAYDGPTELKPSKVADEDPQGGPVTFSGYSGGKRFQKFTATISGEGYAVAKNRPQHGQSGGGVWQDGKLIGVVNAYDQPGNLVFCPIGRCRRQCERQWGFFWGIGGGVCPPRMPPAYPPGPPPGPPVVVPEPRPAPPVEDEQPTAPAPLSLKGDKGDPGPPGPRGANGLMGMRGEPGPAGKDGKDADPSEVARLNALILSLNAEIQKLKNTSIPVQILSEDGSIYDQQTYKLGEPIKLILTPEDKPDVEVEVMP